MKLNINEILCLPPAKQKLLSYLEKRPNSQLKRSKTTTIDLVKQKLISHNAKTDEFALTYSGHDALSLLSLKLKGLQKIHKKIGNGKESEIFLIKYKNKQAAMKINRVGTNSFKSFKNSRNEIKNSKKNSNTINKNKLDWQKCSKMNCEDEYRNLKIMKENKFCVPEVFEYDRHIMIFEYINGINISDMKSNFFDGRENKQEKIENLYDELIGFLVKCKEIGYVHGDYNEFNVMITENRIVFIDFTHLIKIEDNEKIAGEIYEKAVENVKNFMKKRFNFIKF